MAPTESIGGGFFVPAGKAGAALKETLELISVVDALNSEGECFICALIEESEKRALESYLDDEHVMDPEHHAILRHNHLCKHHLYRLVEQQDRLGFALTLRTLYQSAGERLDRVAEDLRRSREADEPGGGLVRELMAALNSLSREMASDSLEGQLAGLLDQGACPLCRANEDLIRRAASAVAGEYRKNGEFRELFRRSRGLCLPHLKSFLEVLHAELPYRQFLPIAEDTLGVTRRFYGDRGEQLEWFIQKFDYIHRDDPWRDCGEAPDKALRRMSGSPQVR